MRILSGLNLMLARQGTAGLELVKSRSGTESNINLELKYSRKNVLRKPGSKSKSCSVFPCCVTWSRLAYLQKFQFLLGMFRTHKIPRAWRSRQPKYTTMGRASGLNVVFMFPLDKHII